jgi:predicted GNAT family acetyltransferase
MQWEYDLIHLGVSSRHERGGHSDMRMVQQALNRAGNEGWEVIAVCPTPPIGDEALFMVFLKRPKSEQRE